MKKFYVYILRNDSTTLYIGITSNLVRRVWEHRNKLIDGFTKKYNIKTLVYFEEFTNPNDAIAREKQLKNWRREKKLDLIKQMNPSFTEIKL